MVPFTGKRGPRPSAKNASGACARTFICRTMSGKSSIGDPLLCCPRNPRKATIAIPVRTKMRKKPRNILVFVHHGEMLTATLLEQPPRFVFSKARIARFDHEKEPVVGRSCEAIPVENWVIPARQPVHDQHRDEAGERGEENRQFEHDR